MSVSQFISSSRDFWTDLNIPSGSNVCFLDASFNPPNLAHVKLARLCRDSFPDCYLVFMSGIGNADKPRVAVEQLQDRVNMMKLMIETEFTNDPKAGLALISQPIFVEKSKISKQHFRDVNIVFAMGFDTLVRVADPRYYQAPSEKSLSDFFRDCHVLVSTRNQDSMTQMPEIGTSTTQVEYSNSSPSSRPFTDRIILHMATDDTDGVSSSYARRSIENSQQTVPKAVAEYVSKHHLYHLSSSTTITTSTTTSGDFRR